MEVVIGREVSFTLPVRPIKYVSFLINISVLSLLIIKFYTNYVTRSLGFIAPEVGRTVQRNITFLRKEGATRFESF
jgi:hypothetical protein